MAGSDGPGETGKTGTGKAFPHSAENLELDRRLRRLDHELAEQRKEQQTRERPARSGNASGYAAAVRLSSEFIAGILVGAGIGWIIDRFAGTSPWGLIVFLLLGFCAGVLNILRSSGMMPERKLSVSQDGARQDGARQDDTKKDGQ